MTRKNKQWLTSCQICNCSITNNGSGRPRNVCSRECKLERMRRVSKARYGPRTRNTGKPKDYVYQQNKARHNNIIAAEKQRRGKCAYHLEYFGNELHVTHDLISIFDFDHVDRSTKLRKGKVTGISQLKGSITDEQLIAEMSKCEVVCANCHRLKTIQNKDYAKLDKNLAQEMQLRLQFK